MKKTIAMLLAFIMVVSVLPVYASKTTEQEFSTEKIKGEVIIPFSEAAVL